MKGPRLINARRAILLGLVATLGIILYVRGNEPRTMPFLHSQNIGQVSPRAVRVAEPREWAIRRVYGHSIVPGGVHSVEDLKHAIVADPLAAQHYAGFDVAKAYVTRLPHDGLYFLSYRLNHKIYFTSVLRLIRGGEEVLTDGNTFILTRCGNEIVTAYHGPVNVPQEPMDLDIVVTELPFVPAPASALTPALPPPSDPALSPSPPPAGNGGTPAAGGGDLPPSVYGPPVGGGISPLGGTPPQISADDLSVPAELSLLICGLAAILVWRLLAR